MVLLSYQSVPPDSVRVWWGYKKRELSDKKFFDSLGRVFIPGTVQIQSRFGLAAYLPTVLPRMKPDPVPDEIALVFYKSRRSYYTAWDTAGGRAYSELHGTVFDRDEPCQSKSAFPGRFTGQPQPDTPYYLFDKEVDWAMGTSRVLVGSPQASQSGSEFIQGIEACLRNIQSGPPEGIDNAYFVMSGHFLLFWEHWDREIGVGERSRGMVDMLSEVVSPLLLKTSRPLSINAGLFDKFQGVRIEGGECLNIHFNRDQPVGAATVPVFGLHGESHAAPPDTEAAYWAALGAGADGVVMGTRLTRDQTLVCYPGNLVSCDPQEMLPIATMDDAAFGQIDAGKDFRSSVLDEHNRTTGEMGADTPWDATVDKRRLGYPTTEAMLRLFGRRTQIMLLIDDPQHTAPIARHAAALLKKMGLEKRVTVLTNASGCEVFGAECPETRLAYIADQQDGLEENLAAAVTAKADCLLIAIEKLLTVPIDRVGAIAMETLIYSANPAPAPEDLAKINVMMSPGAVLAKSVARAVRMQSPARLVMEDDFSGTSVNQDLWTCGYSRTNQDTRLAQNDGFIIAIEQGGEYSGGAVVSRIPIHGAFDAQVDFTVDNPCQATTFELAAMGIDPGYFNLDDPSNARKVNLTFDVHGAPPYASSERDEDDGFRIGWNNSANLTRIDSDWSSRSANMYNKYGRDVGYAGKDSPQGTLRLTRNGAVFNAYYKDRFNPAWVCSGSALVTNLGEDVFIRLAAKHWEKGGVPPANRVVFKKFRLYQF